MKAIEYEIPNGWPDWSEHMGTVMHVLVSRKDRLGRTRLQYVSERCPHLSRAEFFQRELKIMEDIKQEPSNEEWALLQEERTNMETRNHGFIVEVCQWILSIDQSAAFVYDSEGMNSFHFALAKGKKWGDGLEDLAKLVPKWPKSRERKTGLYPFMLAATPDYVRDTSIHTIYELLCFDASILQGIACKEHDGTD